MSARLRLALDKVAAAQWQLFERLASAFLADEYGELRTLAAPSGDEGRDAQLFQPQDDATIALQYSVATDWNQKIRKTARRLSDKHPDVSVLVYVSPHQIAAKGDTDKRDVRRDFHIHLDIRDQHYFAERVQRSPATAHAAEQFCRAVLDPFLADAGVIDRKSSPLSTEESRAALLYLVLQRHDDQLNRHLTKLSYDALVKAALRKTDTEHRLTRAAIRSFASSLLSTHPADEVHEYVDRALERLSGNVLRHYRKADEFCLSYEERVRLSEGLANLALLNEELQRELEANLSFVASAMGVDISVVSSDFLIDRLRRVMERFLLERGEAFVESLTSGQVMLFVSEELAQSALTDLLTHPDSSSLRHNIVSLVAETLDRVLRLPGVNVQQYLRGIADAYTLLAFLRETPNVQSAVTKLFSHGEIWLDTTAILPLLAEELLDTESRSYSRLIAAAREAGVRLYVSPGVIDEVLAHIDLSLTACRLRASWNWRTPFLFAAYIWSGHQVIRFANWLEVFRGAARPIDDVIEYLRLTHGVEVLDLSGLLSQVPADIRWQCEAYWQEVHEARRPGTSTPPEIIRQLVRHDVENFLGVLMRRHGEEVGNPFGYSTWWLALDKRATMAANEINKRLEGIQLSSPVLTFDFLMYYLAVGPARRALQKRSEESLPLALDQSLLDGLPRDLLAAAEAARKDVEGQDDRIIRRKIRDHLDQEKLRSAGVGRTTIDAIKDDIRNALEWRSKGNIAIR